MCTYRTLSLRLPCGNSPLPGNRIPVLVILNICAIQNRVEILNAEYDQNVLHIEVDSLNES